MSDAELTVDDVVRRFARVIAAASQEVATISRLTDRPDIFSDWLQASWEILVEGALPPLTFLEVYGEGADISARSSRVSAPTATPTHAIVVKPLHPSGLARDLISGRDVAIDAACGLAVEELVAMEGTWYVRKAPFDCVLVLTEGEDQVFRASDVTFDLGPPSRG